MELAAIFRTEFQVDDYFTGFEFECPRADDEIPEGTYWAPGRQQGEYRLTMGSPEWLVEGRDRHLQGTVQVREKRET